ncbi:MAG TPA: hypothetical protein VFM48_07130 [Aquabacterium sp.]|nr:hypothetical protein [Aquabacterium sp.]
MSRFLKIFAIWVAVNAIVWLFTLWQWQQNTVDVGLSDIVVRLLIVPIALVLAWVLVLWGVQRLKEKAVSPSSTTGPSTTNGTPESADGMPSRLAHAWILDASVVTRLGADLASTWEQVRAAELRPGLDPTLQDYDGLPVFSARVIDLVVDDQAHPSALESDERSSDLARRAIALAEPVMQQLMDTALLMHEQLEVVEEPLPVQAGVGSAAESFLEGKSHLSGMSRQRSSAAPDENRQVSWHIDLLLPAIWPEAVRAQVDARLQGRMDEFRQRVGESSPVRWRVLEPDTPEVWWQTLDQQLRMWQSHASSEAWLTLAVDSAIDESIVDQWQAVGTLFTPRHQSGRIPGEAAAGVLFASPALWSRLSVGWDGAEPVRLHRPICLKRDKSADAIGRVGPETLAEALSRALSAASLDPSVNLMVISDADHRASRTSELFEALHAVKPGVDPISHVLRAGEYLGDIGMANTLMSTALACAAVGAGEQEVTALAAHVQSSHERVVVTLCSGNDRVAHPA